MLRIILLLIVLSSADFSFSQGGRLVINGGYIHISGGTRLVIDNSQSNAVSRTVAGGHIISEHEDAVVKWNIGSNNGAYMMPFGVSHTHYLPLEFTTYGGVGDGYIELATYGGSHFKNSDYLPTGISNFTGFGVVDNSPYVMDRFWKLKARNYASSNQDRPAFHHLSLSYLDSEHTNVGNIINESNVFIQRYNPVLDSWYDYIPGGGTILSDLINNTVAVNVVPHDEIFDWWAIVEKISPLPVELISFDAQAVDNVAVYLEWVTSLSSNIDKYIIERSVDAVNWEYVFESAAVNTDDQIKYSGMDFHPYLGQSYYRLKYTEMDGSLYFSDVKSVNIYPSGQLTYLLYPNPTDKTVFVKLNMDHDYESLVVYDAKGSLMMKKDVRTSSQKDLISIDVSTLPQGSYILQLQSKKEGLKTNKFVKL